MSPSDQRGGPGVSTVFTACVASAAHHPNEASCPPLSRRPPGARPPRPYIIPCCWRCCCGCPCALLTTHAPRAFAPNAPSFSPPPTRPVGMDGSEGARAPRPPRTPLQQQQRAAPQLHFGKGFFPTHPQPLRPNGIGRPHAHTHTATPSWVGIGPVVSNQGAIICPCVGRCPALAHPAAARSGNNKQTHAQPAHPNGLGHLPSPAPLALIRSTHGPVPPPPKNTHTPTHITGERGSVQRGPTRPFLPFLPRPTLQPPSQTTRVQKDAAAAVDPGLPGSAAQRQQCKCLHRLKGLGKGRGKDLGGGRAAGGA